MKRAKIMDNNLSIYELVHYTFKNQLNCITAIACFYASKLILSGLSWTIFFYLITS